MEDLIFEAATKGDVNALRNTKGIDSMLNKFVAGCFNWTPLHVAASFGHKEFAQELLTRNPELIWALDSQGRSPLHLAAQKGNVDIVELLLDHGSKICMSRDQTGRCPLHVAAVDGKVEVLRMLLGVNLEVARDRLDREETVLHLCVKHQQFDSLKLLLETIRDEDFVNAKDNRGNTILHTAVYERNPNVVKFVLENSQIEVNTKNLSNQTPLDISLILGKTAKGGEKEKLNEIKSFLGGASGKDGTDLESFNWKEKKDIIMVVASVLATASFQAVMNPPGGVWQDDKDGHRAGESVLAFHHPNLYLAILFANIITFIGSAMLMLMITALVNTTTTKYLGIYFTFYSVFVLCFLGFSFAGSVRAVTPFTISLSLPNHYSEVKLKLRPVTILSGIILIQFGLAFFIFLIKTLVSVIVWFRNLQNRRMLLARLRDPHLSGVSSVGPTTASSVSPSTVSSGGPSRIASGIP